MKLSTRAGRLFPLLNFNKAAKTVHYMKKRARSSRSGTRATGVRTKPAAHKKTASSGAGSSRRLPKVPLKRGRGGVNFSRSRSSSKLTIDHDKIRSWAESRGGKPATVKTTGRSKKVPGIIRLDFPGYRGARSLKAISWEEWFEKFEESNLALLYQDKTSSGKPSRFNKLISRD